MLISRGICGERKYLSAKYKTLIALLLFVFTTNLPTLNAQVFWDTVGSEDVNTCLIAKKEYVKFTVLNNFAIGAKFKVKFPVGLEFVKFTSVKLNTSVISFTDSVSANKRIAQFIINVAGAVGDVFEIEFERFANCNAGTGSYTQTDTMDLLTSIGLITTNGSPFNGYSPALSITNIANTPALVAVGNTTTRKFTVTNGGNGATKRFFLSDNFGAGNLNILTGSFKINPLGVNYSIPTSNITLTADSVYILIDSLVISKIGDLDSLMEINESFEISYAITPLNCGKGFAMISTFRVGWFCKGNVSCNETKVSSGLGLTIPGSPNLAYLKTLQRLKLCYNNSIQIDTAIVKNYGSGPALDIKLMVGVNGYPIMVRPDMAGYLDTSMFFIKIGKNGTWYKPNFIVSSVANTALNWVGCNLNGLPTSVDFTVPIMLAGDSLFFTAPIKYCNWNYPCNTSQDYLNQIPIPGSIMEIYGYKNGCSNINYSGFEASIVGYSYPALQAQNNAPTSANSLTKANFLQVLQNIPVYSPNSTAKSVIDITINLPSVLLFDSSATNLVSITNSDGTIIKPTRRINANVFRFKTDNITGKGELNIMLKGYCDPNICSGIVNWGYKFDINPDTSSCTSFNTMGCVTFPISWVSDCRVCCDSGLINLEYTTNRVNFGKPDNDNDLLPDVSGSINLSKVRNNYFLKNDTIEYYQKSYIKAGVSGSFSTLIGEFNIPNGTSYWDYLSNELIVKRGTSIVTTASVTNNWSGNLLQFNYTPYGPFLDSDTIYFKVRLRLKQNIQTSYNTQNQSYASQINSLTQSVATRFSCGPILDNMTLWNHVQFLDKVQTMISNGCTQVYEYNNYFVAEGAYGYNTINRFPYEYRPNGYPTLTKHKYPSGWVVDSVEVYYNYGSNMPATYYNKNIPFTFVNDTLKYDLSYLYTDNGGQIIPVDEGGLITIRHVLSPTCKVIANFTTAVPSQCNFKTYVDKVNYYEINSASYNTSTTINNVQAQYIVNSTSPVAIAYTKKINWNFAYSNVTAINGNYNWFYFKNASGKTTIDSVKRGSVLVTPDINGFYRIGNLLASSTANFSVYGNTTTCNLDSLEIIYGYGCNNYPTIPNFTCNNKPSYLFVLPAPVGLQSKFTPLTNTPKSTFTPTTGDFGQSTIDMCSNFPMECKITSTETGTAFNVIEKLYLPISGLNVGLDYVADSGTIEYPIGTTPRLFSATANTAILSQVSTGIITLDLEQIDPVNFNNNKGLKGIGESVSVNERTAIIRLKLKTNCNLRVGNQFQLVQSAKSFCGASVQGTGQTLNSYNLNVTGVTAPPYLGGVNISPNITGCRGDSAIFKVVKIGSVSPSVGDSLRIFIPNELDYSPFYCYGAACPSATPIFTVSPAIGGKELSLRIPSSLGNLDSIVLKTVLNTKDNFGCPRTMRIYSDITRQLSLYCASTGLNCTNATQSMGGGQVILSLYKPELDIQNFYGNLEYSNTQYVYKFAGVIKNLSTTTSVNNLDSTTVDIYWDNNYNLAFDSGIDLLVHKHVSTAAILKNGGTLTFTDTFHKASGFIPDSTRAMFAVIDVANKSNCNCSKKAISSMVIGLPFQWVLKEGTYLPGLGNKLNWTISDESLVKEYLIEKFNASTNTMDLIGRIASQGNIGKTKYEFIDNLVNTTNGTDYYRIRPINVGASNISPADIWISYDLSDLSKNLQIYPNPTSDLLTIQIPNAKAGVCKIYDQTGRIITEFSLDKLVNSQTISTANWSVGVYHVQLIQGGNVYQRKLIKQ